MDYPKFKTENEFLQWLQDALLEQPLTIARIKVSSEFKALDVETTDGGRFVLTARKV